MKKIKNLILRIIHVTISFLGRFSYAKDGLYTVHNADFINDSDFQAAYMAGKKTGSWKNMDIEWRVHTVLWAAKQAFNLDGDFVECGTNKGGLARAIIEYLDFGNSDKKFYLLDTFEGFDVKLLLDTEKKKYTSSKIYEETYEEVKKTFTSYDNVKIIRGAVPYTLSQVETQKVAYLSIDMNCVQPEVAALDFFWPKMVQGGVIVLDDFAYVGFNEQNKAHKKWAKKNNVEILTIPTGQGLIIKS